MVRLAYYPKLSARTLILALCATLLVTAASAQVVDRSSMTNKILCGYQGWHCCPGDGNDAGVGWYHWADDRAWIGPTNYHTEIWPDVTEYDASDLFFVPNTTLSQGGTPYLYSASKPGVVNTHFRWMQEYNIDGVFLQRFLVDLGDARFFNMRATVTSNVQNAANTYGRTWALEYDISGVPEGELYNRITSDWAAFKSTYNIVNDPRYLHHNGRPVVAVWGFGYLDRPGTPQMCIDVINYLKNDGCYVVGGVCGGWRDLTMGSKTDPAWNTAYRSFDCITPWTVGGYVDWNGINNYKNRAQADLNLCNSLGILYMTTAWPRFGWDNMNDYPCGQSDMSPRGGQHLWDQFYAFKSIGVPVQFLAMYDEYDESTAILKLTDNVPTSGCWWNTQGYGKDWYLRLAGQGSRMQRGEIATSQTIPINSATAPDNAAIVSDTIPTTMNPGAQYNVSVTVRNTGETTWNAREFWKLGSVGDSDPFYVGGRVLVDPGTVVLPNQTYTFYFTMTAPATPNTYTSDWQMVHEMIRWFGATLTKQITVGGGGSANNAQYISDTIPTQMNPGQQYNVSVTMKNTGTTTWSESTQHRLGGVDNNDPLYPPARLYLSGGETIAPQAQKTFSFTMTAPATPGQYVTDWRMLRENVEWFGDTLTRNVTVGTATSTIDAKAAGAITIDGATGDWNLGQFTTISRGGLNESGDYAIVGYDGGSLYYAGNYTPWPLPTSATDHTAKVYSREDATYVYLLVRCDDSDMRYNNPADSNWANDCVEFYIDPSHNHGASPMSNSTSDVQLVIDANNQKNVYMTTSGYRTQVLNGVTSAVVRDGTGWWLELRITKTALDPDMPASGAFGIDFAFRDNDNNNDAALSSIYCWRDTERSSVFPSKIPDRWGNCVLP